MKSLLFAVFAFFSFFIRAHAQSIGPKPTLAVLTFDVDRGVTTDEARILADRLAIELDRTGKFTLINRQRMVDQLELQQFSRLDACSASECAVEAGRILGADGMVYGSIGQVGGTFSLNSYLIMVESGATLQSASTDIPSSIEEMLTQGIARNAAELATPAAAGAESRPTCAVLTFDSRGGVSLDEVRIFTDRFAIELDSLRQYTLVPRSKMKEVLQEQEFSRSDNCSAAECAMEAGKLLGVRYMAYGSIGLIGSLFTINTYLVDVETGAAVKTATTDYRGDKESVLTRGMRQNALNLLGAELQQGYLNIQVNPDYALLAINGQHIASGQIPVAADTPINVTAYANGYSPYSQIHHVQAGETVHIGIRLSKTRSAPPAPKNTSPKPRRPRVH